jgi:hypothetical protein
VREVTPERRRRRYAIAADLVVRLNAPAPGRQAKNIRRLANEKPQVSYAPGAVAGKLVPSGYSRSTVTALRRRGMTTLYWHSKRRCFLVKVDKTTKAEHEHKRLLLDRFARVSGMVARCAGGGCGLFYVRRDARMLFCSTKCADRDRQQRRRAKIRALRPEAKVAFREAEAKRAAERQRIEAYQAARPYYDEQHARALDQRARAEQRAEHRGR